MQLSRIMTRFHNFERQWICQFNREIDIFSFTFLSEVSEFEANILYFGYSSELPATIPHMKLTFLCIEDSVIPDHYRTESISSLNLITFSASVTQMQVLKILTSIFGEAARTSSGKAHLVDALHLSLGMQAIVDTAYELLQNPVTVVDSSYKILAMFSDLSDIDGRDDLFRQRDLGYMLQENIDAMKHDRIYEQARENKYPFYYRSQEGAHGWITSLIYIHGIEVGQIGVMESRHTFTETDFELIDFLSKVISLELQKSELYRENRGMMHSYFLSDLLDRKIHDDTTILSRMEGLNWNLSKQLYILIIDDSVKNFYDGKAQLITQQLQHMLVNSRWVIYQGQIVFLVSGNEGDAKQFFAPLTDYLTINHLTASVSNRFEHVLSIRNFYEQAKKAAGFGQRFQPKQAVHFYSDYMFYHMGEIAGIEHSLSDFYHPGILAIRDYDKEHQSNFLRTLKLYLTHIDDPGKVASTLYIHKNTVFYRINKIKEQFHIDLDDGEERFKIHMTIKLMELE
ncbi:MAG: PucR family transcriptional regulator [Lachnospiraceae bacterium]